MGKYGGHHRRGVAALGRWESYAEWATPVISFWGRYVAFQRVGDSGIHTLPCSSPCAKSSSGSFPRSFPESPSDPKHHYPRSPGVPLGLYTVTSSDPLYEQQLQDVGWAGTGKINPWGVHKTLTSCPSYDRGNSISQGYTPGSQIIVASFETVQPSTTGT